MAILDLRDLTRESLGTCVSIYLPTHRKSTEIEQDRTRFKNLLNQAKKELDQMGIKGDDFLAGAQEIHDDYGFWNHMTEGLAVLIDSEEVYILKLIGETPERVVVGEGFHIKPLLNDYELLNDLFLLDISKDRFELYYANSEDIEELDLEGQIFTKFTDLFDDKDIKSDLQVSGGAKGGFHGNKSKPEEDQKDVEKYHRYVAEELKKYFGEAKPPMVIFGTSEVVADFISLAQGLNIVDRIEKPLASLDKLEIYKELKDSLLPKFIEKMEGEIQLLKAEIGKDKGTDNSSRILRDRESGRIQKVFIEKNYDGLRLEEIDQIIKSVLNTDGQVLIVDKERNDFSMGMGAIYRY